MANLPPTLPKLLGLTEADIDRVTEIIEACKQEQALTVGQFIEYLAGLTLEQDPREAALFQLRDQYHLLVRGVAYRVMARERGGQAVG